MKPAETPHPFAEALELEHIEAAELRNVSVSFGERTVVRDVSALFTRGSRTIVFGESGAGKSTLLHVLAGVIPHSMTVELSGTALVNGCDTSDHDVAWLSQYIGVVAQDPSSQVCFGNVDDEVALGLENSAVPPALIASRIEAALQTVGVSQLRGRSTAELSGGEGQRVALAAALAPGPQTLLLDEPTSMLDADGVIAVREAVDRAVSATDSTVVMVEHRLDDLADESEDGLPECCVVLGADGVIVAAGDTNTVLRDRASSLRATGCWLPLDTELQALTGQSGGIDDERNREFLLGLVPNVCGRDTRNSQVTLLSARELTIGRGGRAVSRGLDVELLAGEVTLLLGRNGIGKSTLLATLAGLIPPLAGTCTSERVGMVFQNPEHQFVAGNVADEIAYGLAAENRADATEKALERHRLTHVRHLNPWRLSGGEKRRLSLAAMLAHERPVVLADEPTFGLDRRDALVATDAIREAADSGRAVLVATHDVRSLARIADRVIITDRDGVVCDTDAAFALRDATGLASRGIRVPSVVSMFAEHCASSWQLQEALTAFERAEVLA